MALDSTTDGSGGCYVRYHGAANTISILNDSGSMWSTPIALGVPGTLSNSQCQVDPGSSSFSASGANLIVNLALAFAPEFTGSQNIYMEARDQGGLDSGWQPRGVYQVNPCANTTIYAEDLILRVAGNDLLFRSRTWPLGAGSSFWTASVRATGRLDLVVIPGRLNVSATAQPGQQAVVEWHEYPQTRGVGFYQLQGRHEAQSGCGYQATPLDLTASLTVERPTISGNDRFWYLGGAPSIDGYYVQTLLTADPRTTVAQPYWSVTQNPSKVSLSCSVCTQNTITSLDASTPGQMDVKVKVSVGGLESAEFPLGINTPHLMVYPGIVPTTPHSSGPGYVTTIEYRVRDLWSGGPLVPITLHETLENWQRDWPTPLIGWLPDPTAGVWPASLWEFSASLGQWYFSDFLYAYDNTGQWNPQPTPFVGGVQRVKHGTQKFFVGSPTPFSGTCVQRNRFQLYTDHGEAEERTSPVSASACAPGQVLP